MSSEGPRTESFDSQEEAQSPSLRVGELVLEKYRVERPIGRGGMGEVYEATHVTLGSRVALKLPLAKRVSGRGAARLLREARVAASLDPERVVRVLDVGVLQDGRPVIVLERLDGETLAERIARAPELSVIEAVDFAVEACLGLADAHAAGIVHRDVKPSNLFVARRRDGSTILKVLDFGVAGFRAPRDGEDARLTDSHTPVGSPPYMAPEQIRARDVDARADVWGLGVTLFEMLAHRLPFQGPTTAAISAAIVADDPVSLRGVRGDLPEGLAELVSRCLSKVVAERPADARALARELAPYASITQRDNIGAAHTANSQDRVSLSSLASARALSASRTIPTGSSTQPLRTKAPWLVAGAMALGLIVWLVFFGRGSVAPSSPSVSEEPGPSVAAVAEGVTPARATTDAVSVPAVVPTTAVASSLTSAHVLATNSASSKLLTATSPRPTKPVASSSAAPTATHIMDQRKF